MNTAQPTAGAKSFPPGLLRHIPSLTAPRVLRCPMVAASMNEALDRLAPYGLLDQSVTALADGTFEVEFSASFTQESMLDMVDGWPLGLPTERWLLAV